MVTHLRCVGIGLVFALLGWSLVAMAAGPDTAVSNPDSLAWWADRLTGTGGLGVLGLILGRFGGVPLVLSGRVTVAPPPDQQP